MIVPDLRVCARAKMPILIRNTIIGVGVRAVFKEEKDRSNGTNSQ